LDRTENQRRGERKSEKQNVDANGREFSRMKLVRTSTVVFLDGRVILRFQATARIQSLLVAMVRPTFGTYGANHKSVQVIIKQGFAI
jgi:hypothetical protein